MSERSVFPAWLRRPLGGLGTGISLHRVFRKHNLKTVCRSAHCPNIFDCWGRKRATFLILGDICTRACRYCSVGQRKAAGLPRPVDPAEPERVAAAVEELGIEEVVVTSVTRDDLPDHGARQFSLTLAAVKRITNKADTGNSRRTVELLVPELTDEGVDEIMAGEPDIFGHNIETVPRLYAQVRPGANYDRALAILNRASSWNGRSGKRAGVKSGLMVGLGETFDEVIDTLKDIKTAGVSIVTIGQYLRPSRAAMKVVRFVSPDEFKAIESVAWELGFHSVAAGPFVRSSYLGQQRELPPGTSASPFMRGSHS